MNIKQIAENIVEIQKRGKYEFISIGDAQFKENSAYELARAYLELKAENEKLKFQSSVFNEVLKQNRYLVTKLKKANETIHGEFCGKNVIHCT